MNINYRATATAESARLFSPHCPNGATKWANLPKNSGLISKKIKNP